MGTHWYVTDGKGGVIPSVLTKPEAVYVKKFWETELKKQDKKKTKDQTSSLAASLQRPKSRPLQVTPTKNPKKVTKKVGFSPLSPLKTRPKSRSLTKREEVTVLDEEDWPTPKEAPPQTKRKSP